MKQIVLPTIFTAVDKFSDKVSGMGKTMSDFANRTEKDIARSNRAWRQVGETSKDVAAKSALVGTALLTPLALAAKAAIDFEDKMADVAKVANVEIGSAGFNELSDQAKNIGVFLGIGATEAAGLMAGLAQGGVVANDLERVATIAGKMGVAFGISGDEAGTAFIKSKNALGGTIESTSKLMDTINALSNTMAASAPEILTFMASGGAGVARAVGDSGEQLAAFGAQLIAIGKSSEESATIMQRFTKGVLTNAKLRKVFEEAGGGAQGLMKILEGFQGKDVGAFIKAFGEYGQPIKQLSGVYDQLAVAIGNSTDAQLVSDSVNKEFANRMNTTGAKLKQAQANAEALWITIGTELLPEINKLVQKVQPLITDMVDWARKNKDTVKTILKITAVLSGAAFALSVLAGAIWVASQFMLAFNAIAMLNPIALTVAGAILAIGVLIVTIAWMIRKWDDFGAAANAALTLIFPPLGITIALIQMIRTKWESVSNAFKSEGMLSGIKAIGKSLLDLILHPMQQIFELISKIPVIGVAAKLPAEKLAGLRKDMGLTETEAAISTPVVSKDEATSESFSEMIRREVQNVVIEIRDNTGRAQVNQGNGAIPVKVNSTFGVGW